MVLCELLFRVKNSLCGERKRLEWCDKVENKSAGDLRHATKVDTQMVRWVIIIIHPPAVNLLITHSIG